MLAEFLDAPVSVGRPPAGAVNVCRGAPVEGPGGRWVPCVSAVEHRKFLPGVFQVGPGRHQVCAEAHPFDSVADALSLAVILAETAAA